MAWRMLQRSAVWLLAGCERPDRRLGVATSDRPAHETFIELLQEHFDADPVTTRTKGRAL